MKYYVHWNHSYRGSEAELISDLLFNVITQQSRKSSSIKPAVHSTTTKASGTKNQQSAVSLRWCCPAHRLFATRTRLMNSY